MIALFSVIGAVSLAVNIISPFTQLDFPNAT